MVRTQILVDTGEDPEEGFRGGFSDRLNQKFKSIFGTVKGNPNP